MKETKVMYPSWSDDHGVKLENVKISDLHDFKEHPFHVVLVDNIVVNGYRVFLDRSRGKHINDCIISVQFSRKEFDKLYLRNADGEAVIRRIGKNVPSDFTVEPIHATPIYDSGILNVFYVK